MRNAHIALFFVVFIDLLGLGILAPLAPFYVARLGVSPEIITLVIAVYSLCQFIGTPFWGGISDRIGRKPVLLISMAGHALSYLILAYADSLAMLILSRALGGFTSANLATAYAYVTDTTTEEDRAANLGRISAAFGLGFIFGPLIGGLLASAGGGPETNFVLPALTAMTLSLISCAGIWFFIPESAPSQVAADGPASRPDGRLLSNFIEVSKRPVISKAIILALMVLLFIAGREAIFPLWADEKHGLSIRQLGLVISIGGAVLTIFQMTMIGRVTRQFGEANLVRASVVLFGVSWLGLAFARSIHEIIAVTVIGSIAMALFQTSLQSLLSKRAAPSERGAVMGVYQATSSFGRFGGQAVSGTVYGQIGIDAVFLLGAAVMAPALFIASLISRTVSKENRDRDRAPAPNAVLSAEVGEKHGPQQF